MTEFWLSLFVVGILAASVVYVIALRMQVMAIVDCVWSGGIGLGALAYLMVSGHDSMRAYIVTALIVVWSFRLTNYLLMDRVVKGEEDPRYVNLAAYWGKHSKRNFYGLFIAQVFLVLLFLWPVSVAQSADGADWIWSDWLGVSIAFIALLGEFIADQQLAMFRADPENKGQVCRKGLWRYTRHPNYFFEWFHWWAYVAFAFSSAWWWALVGPAAIYVFLRYLTGVPHAERSSLKSRGEDYRHYQKTTNTFFPWIPHEPQP